MIEGRLNRSLWGMALVAAMVLPVSIYSPVQAQDETPEDQDAVKQDFTKLKSPVPYSKRSISKGRQIYMRYCTECHGPDGKALIDVIADATDLTNPKRWFSGTTEGEVYRSIRDGAGVSMPPFKLQFKKDEDLWNLTNYIQSLWPKDQRPELQEPNASQKKNTPGTTTSESEGESNE